MKNLARGLMLLAAAFSPLWAGSISMQTTMDGSARNGVFTMTVRVTNRGDEAAYNVQVKADASMSPSESKLQSVLPVGATYTAKLSQPLAKLPFGRYPFATRILYADANLYPFSALAISTFVHQKDSASRILGVLEKTELERRGRLTLKLRSLEEQAQELRVRLLLPQELSTESPAQEVRLLPQEETVLKFPIRNFSALEGSVYAVYALVEYEKDGLHCTTLVPGTVRIHAEEPLSYYWKYGAGLLLVLFILMNVLPSWKRKTAAPVKK